MHSSSTDLKSEREKRKIPLAQIAADTHISLHYLHCLEEGRYEDLPGGMYNRAFLRAYCESIGIDRETAKRYEDIVTPQNEKLAKPRPQYPRQDTLSRSTPIVAWSLMLLISATGLFLSRKWISAAFSPYFSQTAATETNNEPAPAPQSLSVKEPVTPIHASSASSALHAPIRADDNSLEEPLMKATIEAAPDNPSPVQLLRLEFEALDQCWISIDNDRGPVVRRLLEPGEAQAFSAAEEFFIVVGNAGGVQLKINGKRAKPLGETGEVVRIRINEETLPEFIDKTAG
jgi:cytoskeletal protein RodZ